MYSEAQAVTLFMLMLFISNSYQDYKIICGLYYGGRKLVSEVVTTSQPKWALMFGETLLWDEW